MKRVLSSLIVLSMIFGLAAFQCSSTELTSAKLYIQQKNLPKAKEALEKEINKNPKSDEGLYLMGYIYGEEGDMAKMMNYFNKSLSVSNKFFPDIDNAKKFHWQNSFNKGVGLFNRATKAADKDTSRMYFEKSVQAFNDAILCQPDSVDSYKNLTYSYLNLGQLEKAADPLLKVIEIKKDADSYAILGEIYYNNGINLMKNYYEEKSISDSLNAMDYFDKTIDLLEEARKIHPDNSDILAILSNAYINANKLDVAMDTFSEGIKKDPANKYYRYNYGVLLLGAEKYQEAADQFVEAINLDPDYTNAHYNLGVTYVKWGSDIRESAVDEDDESKEYLEKFRLSLEPLNKYVEKNPEDGKVWDLLGKVYANLGMNEESMKAFEKADLYR